MAVGGTDSKLGPFNIGDISTAVSIVGGLAGLVYIVGAFVLTVRLTLYALPTEAVVVQIPQTTLLAVGLTEVVLPALGIVFVFGVYRLILGSSVRWWGTHRTEGTPLPRHIQRVRGWRWIWQAVLRFQLVLETFVAASLTYFVFALARPKTFTGHEGGDLPPSLPTVPLPFLNGYVATVVAAIVAVFVAALVATAIASLYVGREFNTEVREVGKMIVIIAMMTTVLMTLFATTLPFLDVRVCRRGAPDVTGWLVATSADRLYIGQQPNPSPVGHQPSPSSVGRQPSPSYANRYVESVPVSDATDLFISGEVERTSCPA